MTTPPEHIEIDGVPAADPGLLAALMSGFGHFTAMQVRDGRVKGPSSTGAPRRTSSTWAASARATTARRPYAPATTRPR
ncbi:hypothetical protein [Streptomyces exfoliatus]|uniref:hypothetical protein n=1 Tax=Streptomyces exfoliatus TaxID=1905 RepID=UPI0037B7ABE2